MFTDLKDACVYLRNLDKQQILAQKVLSWRKKRMTRMARMNACEVAGSVAIVGIRRAYQ